jgi:hypothetical protein
VNGGVNLVKLSVIGLMEYFIVCVFYVNNVLNKAVETILTYLLFMLNMLQTELLCCLLCWVFCVRLSSRDSCCIYAVPIL